MKKYSVLFKYQIKKEVRHDTRYYVFLIPPRGWLSPIYSSVQCPVYTYPFVEHGA